MKKILATGGLAMFAMGAIAADNPGWYLTPKLGYTITDNDRRADDAPAFGLGIGRYLNDRWAFELSGLAGDHDRSPSGDLDLTSLSVDVLRQFNTGSHVSPYLTAGIGNLKNEVSPGSTRDDFMWQAGAGLMIRAWENSAGTSSFSIRPEAKLRWDDAGRAGKLKDVLLGIGFQFGFGGSKAVAAAPVVAAPAPAPAPAPVVVAPPPVVVAPPRPMDSDRDGVFDDKDQCPGTPNGAAVDDVGCVRKGSITLAGVNFENNSARLLPESLSVLDTVAADLKRYPRLKVEVQGHTDSVGSDAYNQRLSQSRAESVRDRLITQGVDAAQLAAKGYGEAQPVTTNATPEGRSQNRRVAMAVLENPGDVEVKQVR